jgi:hypothetical protein
MRLTVFFDGQFWIGIFEWESGGFARAQRHVFGAEPGDKEILELVKDWVPPSVGDAGNAGEPVLPPAKANPKRLAREAARLLAQRGGSTKAQEALQRELEQRKSEVRRIGRAERDAEEERKRAIARRKAREKHRGH